MTKEKILEPYKNLIGRKIMILSLNGEKTGMRYIGKTLTIEHIGIDPWEDVYFRGPEIGISIYPKCDEYILLKEGL